MPQPLSFWLFIAMLVSGLLTLGGFIPFLLGAVLTAALGFWSFILEPKHPYRYK